LKQTQSHVTNWATYCHPHHHNVGKTFNVRFNIRLLLQEINKSALKMPYSTVIYCICHWCCFEIRCHL